MSGPTIQLWRGIFQREYDTQSALFYYHATLSNYFSFPSGSGLRFHRFRLPSKAHGRSKSARIALFSPYPYHSFAMVKPRTVVFTRIPPRWCGG